MTITKTALVTGSSSGIGLATAKVLASKGFNLMLHGIEANDIGQPLAAAIAAEYAVETDYCCADLAIPSQIETLVQRTLTRFSRIDILVNNAGIQFTSPTVDFPPQKWDQLLAVNLSAPFHLIRLILPNMQQAGWGRIINIASVHGLVGSANKVAYCAAKHGLVGLTKVVALEQAANGITANSICPGWTDTPILHNQFQAFAAQHKVSFEDAKAGLIGTKTPYPSLIQPHAIGAMAAFLCSEAAAAITGAALPIDGAWSAQ